MRYMGAVVSSEDLQSAAVGRMFFVVKESRAWPRRGSRSLARLQSLPPLLLGEELLDGHLPGRTLAIRRKLLGLARVVSNGRGKALQPLTPFEEVAFTRHAHRRQAQLSALPRLEALDG